MRLSSLVLLTAAAIINAAAIKPSTIKAEVPKAATTDTPVVDQVWVDCDRFPDSCYKTDTTGAASSDFAVDLEIAADELAVVAGLAAADLDAGSNNTVSGKGTGNFLVDLTDDTSDTINAIFDRDVDAATTNAAATEAAVVRRVSIGRCKDGGDPSDGTCVLGTDATVSDFTVWSEAVAVDLALVADLAADDLAAGSNDTVSDAIADVLIDEIVENSDGFVNRGAYSDPDFDLDLSGCDYSDSLGLVCNDTDTIDLGASSSVSECNYIDSLTGDCVNECDDVDATSGECLDSVDAATVVISDNLVPFDSGDAETVADDVVVVVAELAANDLVRGSNKTGSLNILEQWIDEAVDGIADALNDLFSRDIDAGTADDETARDAVEIIPASISDKPVSDVLIQAVDELFKGDYPKRARDTGYASRSLTTTIDPDQLRQALSDIGISSVNTARDTDVRADGSDVPKLYICGVAGGPTCNFPSLSGASKSGATTTDDDEGAILIALPEDMTSPRVPDAAALHRRAAAAGTTHTATATATASSSHSTFKTSTSSALKSSSSSAKTTTLQSVHTVKTSSSSTQVSATPSSSKRASASTSVSSRTISRSATATAKATAVAVKRATGAARDELSF